MQSFIIYERLNLVQPLPSLSVEVGLVDQHTGFVGDGELHTRGSTWLKLAGRSIDGILEVDLLQLQIEEGQTMWLPSWVSPSSGLGAA